MKKMLKLAVSIMSFSLTFSSDASITVKDCSKFEAIHPSKAKRYIMCLDENIETLTRHRDTWINKLIIDSKTFEEETGNTQLLPILKRSLSHQKNYLEDTCKYKYLSAMPNTTRASISYKRCQITLLQRHIEDLKLYTM